MDEHAAADHAAYCGPVEGFVARARRGADRRDAQLVPRARLGCGTGSPRYLESRAWAPILLVGEAAGYRGTRVSGMPLTSERQLTGTGPAEATATIVHRVLAELGLEDEVLLWNLVPTHPGTATVEPARRRGAEIEAARRSSTARRGRRAVAVGRLAHARVGGPYVRHPAHGGAAAFRAGLVAALDVG